MKSKIRKFEEIEDWLFCLISDVSGSDPSDNLMEEEMGNLKQFLGGFIGVIIGSKEKYEIPKVKNATTILMSKKMFYRNELRKEQRRLAKKLLSEEV